MRFVLRVITLITAFLPSLALAQPSNTYRLATEGRTFDRYIGSESVGTIRSNETALYMESRSHTRLLAVEYSTYENRVPAALGLELPEERMNLGYTSDGLYRLKVAGTILRSAVPRGKRSDFWAFGLYPSRETDFSRFALGLERNSDSTMHVDATTWTTNRDTTFTLMTGASWERFESHGVRSEPHRLGIAGEYRFRGPRLLVAGGVTGTRGGSPAWLGAVSRYVRLGENGALIPGPNPGVLALIRKKPESLHGMFMLTFFNDPTVNEYVADGITSSFFRGSFGTERVVGTREFNTPVVGHGYENVDMGLIVLTGTYLSIDVSPTAKLTMAEYEFAGTYPRVFGRFADPYLTIMYDSETDIRYNPRLRSLTDPQHDWWTVGVGGRIRLLSGLDPRGRHRQGFLRVEAGLELKNGIRGGHLKGSFGI